MQSVANMFPGGYRPDYANTRARRGVSATAPPQSAAPATTTSGAVLAVSALPHFPVNDADGFAAVSAGRVDTKFALPPALITCLVRHIDAQHNVLATPAIVERCLRDLQRRLMPWVPVERVFGSTMRATVPAGSSPAVKATGNATTTGSRRPAVAVASAGPSPGAAIPGGSLSSLPPITVPQAGSYLSGSHVRLQLAKTTDNSVVIAIGASVLHLLFYAVDEPESRPSLLAHIVQEWLEALKTKGEEHDCMVLLVHSDLIAASEAAARMAEEVQGTTKSAAASASSSQQQQQQQPQQAATPAPPPRPTVSQDKVDAAAAQLRKYYKELQDLKFSRQQMSAYMPNETPMRILERLRPAVIARGGRLRQALQMAIALKRQCPQDPSTKPIPFSTLFHQQQQQVAPTPSPRPAGNGGSSGGPSPAAPSPPSSNTASAVNARRTSVVATSSPSLSPRGAPQPSPQQQQPSPAPRQYFNIQALWRTGFDLVVHYLQYGLVFDARETLENLYLEYYNNSDDYVFLRTPIATLERLGRVPNLFDAHGHAGWDTGRTGYPKALEPGSELLEGLLLIAAAEMACSLLLGEPSAALRRHQTFVQVTREKFEEWTTAEAKAKTQQAIASSPPLAPLAPGVTSATYQQFFLLQCYLSGLRMWWPTSGLCRPRRVPSNRVSPAPAAAATHSAAPQTVDEKQQETQQNQQGEQQQQQQQPQQEAAQTSSLPDRGTASMFSPLSLPPLEIVTPPATDRQQVLPAPDVDPEDESLAVALSTSPLLLPATSAGANTSNGAVAFTTTDVTSACAVPPRDSAAAAGAVSAPTVLDNGSTLSEAAAAGTSSSGVRYSMTNPSFAALGGAVSLSGHSFRGVGSFAGRSDASGAASAPAGPLLVPAVPPAGQAMGDAVEESGTAADPIELVEDAEDAALADFELSYLLAGSEDTVQVSADYLIQLAASTGLVTSLVEPEELAATAESIRDAIECGNNELARELQQRQRQLRRSCAEVATLLEHARDSLAAVAHDLQYRPFLRLADPVAVGGAGQKTADGEVQEDEEKGGGEMNAADAFTTTSPTASTELTTTAFSNVEELSSPAQALRLWRILAAMAALALHIGDQRRREFHLYARLAVTFLSDHPTVTANIVADRLLPYVKTQGWRQIELFVRRLYVEAREQLIRKVGLFNELPGRSSSGAKKGAGDTVSDLERMRRMHSKVWLRIFKTGPAYALYRECILTLISSDESLELQRPRLSSERGSGEAPTSHRSPTAPGINGEAAAAHVSAVAGVAGIVGEEDAVGALDTRLFSFRTKAQWWQELLRIDAVVMTAFYAAEPPEYPLNTFTSPLLVRLEKQRSPSAAATSLNAASFPGAVTGVLKADVDEVVRMSFAMACAVNPLVGPDGALNLRLTSPSSPKPQPGQATVRLQLTLESRKDWDDEDEPTHVVHIHDCEEAVYDEATRQLRTVFLFPICHAGVFRVRRLRLCNGMTWLAHYPQRGSGDGSILNSNSGSGGASGAGGGGGGGMKKVHGLRRSVLHRPFWFSTGHGGGVGGQEQTAASSMRAALNASFQLVTRAPLLCVPEPRSSVHLRLTLPDEAHCFADSVDYATLDVELEDPLFLKVAATASAASAGVSTLSMSGKGAAGAEGSKDGEDVEAAAVKDSENDEGAECTCFYEASPGNLLLPLSVATASAGPSGPGSSGGGGGGRHTHSFYGRLESRLGASFADDVYEMGSQQRMAVISPGYRALLGNDSIAAGNNNNNESLSASPAEAARPRGGNSLFAAVVLGTPSLYRPKNVLLSGGAAGASNRGNLGASFSHFGAAPRSPDGVVGTTASTSAALMNLSTSFAHRGRSTSHHHHHQHQHSSLHPPHHHHHSASRPSPAETQLSSSLRAASYPMLNPAGTPTAPPLSKLNSSDSRYKAMFKSLRIGTGADAAAAAAAPHVDATPALGKASSSNALAADHHHVGRGRSTRSPGRSPHTHRRSPTTSEPSAHDVVVDGDGHRRPGASFLYGAAAPAATAAAAASSPLHEVDAETYELVLVHPVKSAGAGEAKSPATTAAGKAAASVAAPLVARTTVPIHLRAYLGAIPVPEVQTQEATAFSAPEVKAAAAMAASLGQLLQAESHVPTDPLRESVIQLRPCTTVVQAAAEGATTSMTTATKIPIARMRLKIPLLPLLATPASAAPAKSVIPADAASLSNNNNNSGAATATASTSSPPSSSSEAAKQARFTFTCMRGREPSTTALSVVVPFQLAISFDYAFKHFQGRVYCLVRMKNLLKTTSLWMRGAVLRVLDPEPSYEIVRVCDVYNELLMTEWKPQEELSILYELDLIASFHPVQPECAHQVQMQVFYSSWERSFLTTAPEDRLVLRTVQLPPTEATAESVELIHGEGLLSSPLSPAPAATTTAGARVGSGRGSELHDNNTNNNNSDHGSFLPYRSEQGEAPSGSQSSPGTPLPASTHQRQATNRFTGSNSSPANSRTHTSVGALGGGFGVSTTGTSGLSEHSAGSVTRSATNVVHSASSNSLAGSDDSTDGDAAASDDDSSTAASGAVHFNVVTLRYLEENCNAVCGPVATFHSKHLCVFSIVMYAESPWTMRFGAATNYIAKAPATPLSTVTNASLLSSGGAPLPRASVQAAHAHSSTSTFSSSPSGVLNASGGSGGGAAAAGMTSANADSFFGNAMVDQPSDFVFVAGEPVRFCVRLQPLAQNWPEDASMEETFFIRLKYNPTEWMVIGKQRDRRTLSLMEEVTVYFNAVPLLPLASAEGAADPDNVPRSPNAADKTDGAIRSNAADNDEDEEGDSDGSTAENNGEVRAARKAAGARSSRPLAGHAVRDEGILQTPTVEMFWERKKPVAGAPSTGLRHAATSPASPAFSVGSLELLSPASAAAQPPTQGDAVMGEAVLIDVVQFRTWVRVRKHGH